MPIYEYECESCGDRHEALQKMSDAPLLDCPACGKAALVKLISAAGFRLKGGGWYETDFKSGTKKNVAQNDAPAAACGAGGCGAKACADS
ncbi:zinc ribbon domain-containing protein [Ectothiorhodospiraceae bacterium 2226]|nr:zinc ribbon domain-containing protein [Ectothiorhodospiraceae bacterium 2226]